MIFTMICQRCNKSREFYQVRERDTKTKKYWTITRCKVCAFNADITETTSETTVTKRKPEPPSGPWAPGDDE